MPPEIPTLEPTSPRPEQNNQLRFLIDVVIRRWGMVLLFTLAFAGVGGFVGRYIEDDSYQYEALADLFVKPSFWQSPLMADMGGDVFGRVTPKILMHRTNMHELSREVAQTLVQDAIIAGGAESQLTTDKEYQSKADEVLSALVLEALDEQRILRVRARSQRSEAEAERLAELAARAVIEHTRYEQVDAQRDAHAIVKQELNEIRRQLDSAENRQWAYREKMGFQTHAQVWADMERKNVELLEMAATREELVDKMAEMEKALSDNAKALPASLGNVTDSVITDLLSELDELRREQVKMSVVWKTGYPKLVALTDDIAEKKQAVLLAIRELNIGERGGSNLWQRRQELYEQVVNLKSRNTALDIRSASLEKLLIAMVKGLPELADKSFEYEQLAHESEQVRKQFDRMLEKEFEIRTALSRGSTTVEWRDAIVLTNYFQGRNFPVSATALLGALIGLISGIGFAMMLEMMDTSIQSTEDVNHALNLEVIGMIPMMKFAKGRGLSRRRRRQGHVATDDDSEVDACIVTQHDPKSPISEAYRSFRTNFQFATLQSKPKTMMVTSSVPGEGKTTTAVNFAVTMADRGMRVLIVDTDLRRPNVHRVLKMERGPGLADVLREETPLKEVIRPTRVENLWIISSGRVPKNPSELIGSDRMAQLMDELGATFDLVVCDAPSILVVTDPVLLATNVDSVVLVVAVNHARQETIQRAKKLLDTTKAEIAGVVMNGLESTARHYYYYYYYYDDAASPKKRIWN